MNRNQDETREHAGTESTAGESGVPSEPRSADGGGGEEILTLVCIKCGTEYYFSEAGPPTEMVCEKCGNGVFRSYHTSANEQEDENYEDATQRDVRPDDPEGDALPGDLLDLDRV